MKRPNWDEFNTKLYGIMFLVNPLYTCYNVGGGPTQREFLSSLGHKTIIVRLRPAYRSPPPPSLHGQHSGQERGEILVAARGDWEHEVGWIGPPAPAGAASVPKLAPFVDPVAFPALVAALHLPAPRGRCYGHLPRRCKGNAPSEAPRTLPNYALELVSSQSVQ